MKSRLPSGTERIKAWKRGGWGLIESVFNLIFFELPSDYGMSPGRPLLILLALIFSIPYMFAFRRQKRSGIWISLPEDRVHKRKGNPNPVKVAADFPGRPKGLFPCCSRVLRIAFYFSLLSAFRIGWRELNFGRPFG